MLWCNDMQYCCCCDCMIALWVHHNIAVAPNDVRYIGNSIFQLQLHDKVVNAQ